MTVPWWLLEPDAEHTFLTDGLGSQDERAVAARVADGSLALIYLPRSRVITVDLRQLAGPHIAARWYDPTDGQFSTVGGVALPGSGPATIRRGPQDQQLRLRRLDPGFGITSMTICREQAGSNNSSAVRTRIRTTSRHQPQPILLARSARVSQNHSFLRTVVPDVDLACISIASDRFAQKYRLTPITGGGEAFEYRASGVRRLSAGRSAQTDQFRPRHQAHAQL